MTDETSADPPSTDPSHVESVHSSADQPATRQSLGHNVAVSLSAQLLSWIAAVVVVAMLPRYLGPEGIGQLRVVTSIWMVASSFMAFGTDKTVTLQVARSNDEVVQLVAPAIYLRMLLWVITSVVLAIVLLTLGEDSTTTTLAVITGLGALSAVVGSVSTSALHGLENMGALARVTALMSLLLPLAILAAISLDVGIFAIAGLMTASELIRSSLQFYFLRRLATTIAWRTTWSQIRFTARRGLPYLLGGLALMLYREADTIVMAALVDDEQIGWYSSADRLFGTALIIPTVLMTAMTPVLARVHVNDPNRAREMAERTYRTLLLAGIPAGAGLFLVSDRLAVTLFGNAFAGAGPVLGMLGPVLMLVSVTILLGRYALAIGRERFFYLMLLAASLATVPLDMLFVPFFDRNADNGAIGGAVSFVVTESVILIVGTIVLLPSVISRTTGVRLLKVLLAAALMAAVVTPLRHVFPAIPAIVGALVFTIAALLAQTLDEHEREALDAALRRLRSFGRKRAASDAGTS